MKSILCSSSLFLLALSPLGCGPQVCDLSLELTLPLVEFSDELPENALITVTTSAQVMGMQRERIDGLENNNIVFVAGEAEALTAERFLCDAERHFLQDENGDVDESVSCDGEHILFRRSRPAYVAVHIELNSDVIDEEVELFYPPLQGSTCGRVVQSGRGWLDTTDLLD